MGLKTKVCMECKQTKPIGRTKKRCKACRRKRSGGVWAPLPPKKNKQRKPERKNRHHKRPNHVKRNQFATYQDYLQSDWWKYIRTMKLRSVRYKCEECPAPARQIHHMHYKTVGRESLHDLKALCAACHTHKHQPVLEMDAHLDAIACE